MGSKKKTFNTLTTLISYQSSLSHKSFLCQKRWISSSLSRWLFFIEEERKMVILFIFKTKCRQRAVGIWLWTADGPRLLAGKETHRGGSKDHHHCFLVICSWNRVATQCERFSSLQTRLHVPEHHRSYAKSLADLHFSCREATSEWVTFVLGDVIQHVPGEWEINHRYKQGKHLDTK